MKATEWVERIPEHIQTQGVNIKDFMKSNLMDHRRDMEALSMHEVLLICIDCSQGKWKIVDEIMDLDKRGMLPLLP